VRRMLVMTVLAGAAFGLTPVHATEPECKAQRYGVDAGTLHAGVCAGSWCPDVCFIVLEPYCYHDARVESQAVCQ